MLPIRILPANLSSQISAGEVIERPSSVIKELLENSIDAKAKNIDISIEKGGLQSIIVKDDGFGIEKDQLLLAISRHATSKINTLVDLDYINTFGFRGEALASIRAVSRLKLISCSKNSNVAWSIYSEGFSNHTLLQPIAHPLGTSVIVENLFYNIPVRLKFIKNERLEFLKICETIKKIALSHFGINIYFKKNRKLFLVYNAVKKSDDKIFRLKTIFNQIDLNYVLEIKEKIHNITLFGWLIFIPSLSSSFKKIQYCYVNNRFVYNDLINSAIFNALYETTGNKKSVSFVLYITLPSHEIDVNIHPTKNEIKFHKTNIIYFFLYKSILSNLKKSKIKYFSSDFFSKINFNKSKKNNSCSLIVNSVSKIGLEYEKKILFKDIISNHFFKVNSKRFLKEFLFSFGKLLIIFKKYYGLIYYFDTFSLISFPLAKKIVEQYKLKNAIKNNIIPENFLYNFSFFITIEQNKILANNSKLLLKFGFNFILKETYFFLKTIPNFLKNQNLDVFLSNFFTFIFFKKKVCIKDIIKWFDTNILVEKTPWNYEDGILILLEIECFCPSIFKKPPFKLLQKININEALCILKV
ncbi:DNA mismatch repair endonuclease MutL [Buchnera aphidicola (Rhopalosiphum padi)]|uniref:DNA mismatch repair protein MutL n=1 Tax=Buchnera aphidicola subsp. Rhopalosiphum padi TaxID=98793 RepID=A0A4D6Y6N5_BUCRP|nr:DNA mismatch repair endonuclease MutL [Buchnera aphidicola]QCI25187.1 DNA mismatch repair endonuclease MutL [Buchnera aphidicola (Rhopalosiphum padi)]